jgi:hypothetical protein
MPEAPIDEHSNACATEDQIRTRAQRGYGPHVDSVSEAFSVKERPHQELGVSVPARRSLHSTANAFGHGSGAELALHAAARSPFISAM